MLMMRIHGAEDSVLVNGGSYAPSRENSPNSSSTILESQRDTVIDSGVRDAQSEESRLDRVFFIRRCKQV